MRRLVLLLAAILPACVNQSAVDYAFCDADEPCFSTALEHTGVFCGGVECVGNPCYTGYHCNPQNPSKCEGGGYSKDFYDGNACTVESCPDGVWIHTPLKPADYNDHDPCTVDQCDPSSGPTHANTCG